MFKLVGYILFVSLVAFLIYWFLIKPFLIPISYQTSCKLFNTPKPVVFLENDVRKFFSINSTDGTLGRNIEGDLVDDKGTVLENGLKNVQDLNLYPLTYPIGHPYYKENSFGYLNCKDWKTHLTRFPYRISTFGIDFSNSVNKVLVVESNGTDPSPIILDISLNVKGIVVRHGGILLIDGQDLNIRTEFILVESGGLFQAGSALSPGYKFQNKLTITLTNPIDGYKFMGEVASQYTYKVYFPGVIVSKNTPNEFTDHLGDSMMFSNTFGAKVISAGFNGSYHFSGEVGTPKPYYGTWSAYEIDNDGNEISPFVDHTRLLTFFDPTSVEEKQIANIVNVATEYPNVWCRLKDKGSIYKGGVDNTIYLDPRDVGDTILSEWKIGSQIVLTAKTKQFQSVQDPIGMVPIWLDYPDNDPNQIANKNANLTYMAGKTTGVEVATIADIDRNIGKITLVKPLQFDHDSSRIVLNNGSKKIRIDTNTHVALLTRNILITSERLTTPETFPGCNIWHQNMSMPSPGPTKDGKFKGPGGSINCNYKGAYTPSKNITSVCYTNRDSTEFCGPNPSGEKALQTPKGHWILGTEGQTGCNSIHGGSTMFRYGSSIRIDGVELKYMGQPPNFGTIARYAIHFHLMGFVKTFTGYLPLNSDLSDLNFRREGIVCNSSLWCVPTRWVVLHGTSEATIRNNVGFICYGSGYFVEDGTEMRNVIDHNTAICCLTTSIHNYWNPIPIFGNTATDLAVPSCYWYKNNQTVSTRNLGCNCPSSVIHTWGVAQDISVLRGPSSVCIGDEILGLPALGTQKNALSNLNQNGSNNINGKINKYTTTYNGKPTLCWMPDYFLNTYIADNQRCVAFTNSNCQNPLMSSAENIAYCIMGGFSEFPEGTGQEPPTNYNGGYSGQGANSCIIIGNCNSTQPQFLPSNAENTCTDSNAQCAYPEHSWGGDYLPSILSEPTYGYQPLSKDELIMYNKSNYKVTGITFDTTFPPKIQSGWLTFNLGVNTGLYGGPGWTKGSTSFLIGCCFLQDGGGNAAPNVAGQMAAYGIENSSLWTLTTGGQQISGQPAGQFKTFSNSYFVLYDIISNGGVGMPSSPTLLGGDKTFFDNNAKAVSFEYTNSDYQALTYYLSETPVPSKSFWNNMKFLGNSKNVVTIYNLDNNTTFILNNDGTPGTISNIPITTPTTKIPYLCKDQDLLKEPNGLPEWLGIAINANTKNFLSTYSRTILGKKLCTALSKIIGCQPPALQKDRPISNIQCGGNSSK